MLSLVTVLQISLYANTMTLKAFLFHSILYMCKAAKTRGGAYHFFDIWFFFYLKYLELGKLSNEYSLLQAGNFAASACMGEVMHASRYCEKWRFGLWFT